uniref:Uncharacterized protein n=1 Tax=Hucho hucho TaxID=62062 RepID=A0A4W5L2Q1_9TELE
HKTAALLTSLPCLLQYFAINIVADQMMTFGGPTYSISPNKYNGMMYVDFFDMKPQKAAWYNKTFKVLIDAKNAKI